jgi:chromosomal replication initiation ATPase DnaA
MRNKKTSDGARNSFREVFDALVPSVEELDDEEVASILASAGIDPEVVAAKAHHQLQELVGRRYLSQGKSVPSELKNALHQLKPATRAERINLEISKARAVIRSIFKKVKERTVVAVEPVLRPVAPPPAFRNKKDLTDADRKQLAELQEELDNTDAASKEERRGSE